jgi:methionyl-tRNA formyltransferase
MKILVLGTGPFAVPAFEAILADGHQVPLVVTRPTVVSQGRTAAPSPMRVSAETQGIPVFAPDSINSPETMEHLRSFGADLMLVCDYGQILSAEALKVTRWGGINLHGSLLPKYRGAAPVQWCVYHGDAVSGVSVIHLTPRLDGGPVLTQTALEVLPDETAGQLEERLSCLGAEAVRQAIELLARWDGRSPLGCPQDPARVTRAPRLQKAQGQIDWQRSAVDIRNQIRAFQPWPGSFTNYQRSAQQALRLIIVTAQVIDPDRWSLPTTQTAESTPGQVILSDKNALWIKTGDGVLGLTKVQPAGKRVMEIEEFQRGYGVPVGTSLH